jgi:hypothetical protein
MRMILSLLLLAALPVSAQTESKTPYLVPLHTFHVQGANGSRWSADFTMFNASASPVTVDGATENPFILAPVTQYYIQPRVTQEVSIYSLFGEGGFIWVPTAQAATTFMSLRVRDLSQNAQSWGTAIPVVEFDEFSGGITLIDVPTDPRYRAMLRIYHWSESAGWPARVTIIHPATNQVIAQFDTSANGNPYPGNNILMKYPAQARVDLLTPQIRAAAPSVRIEIDNLGANVSPPPPPIWAFVSITNNETQQVTTIVPNRP